VEAGRGEHGVIISSLTRHALGTEGSVGDGVLEECWVGGLCGGQGDGDAHGTVLGLT
jgi:hypothetical protein